jgi:hypothetical protein
MKLSCESLRPHLAGKVPVIVTHEILRECFDMPLHAASEKLVRHIPLCVCVCVCILARSTEFK